MEIEEVENVEQRNVLLYSLSSVFVVVLGFIIYIYLNFDMIKKGDLTNKYIKTDEITFYSLPTYVQNEYINKSSSRNKIDTINQKVEQLKKKNKILVNEKDKLLQTITKHKEQSNIIKKQIIEVVEDKNVSIKVSDNQSVFKKFDVFKCYDMGDGGFYQSDASIENLNKFLENHKDAKYFEIIGVINKLDFKLLREAKSQLNNKQLNLIEQLSQLGLSRKRVIEGTWNIKQYLGEDVSLKVVNYTITSQKDHKGFVIRAYK